MKLAKARLKQIIKEELQSYNKKTLVKEYSSKEQDLAGKVQDLIEHIEGMDSVPTPVEDLLAAAKTVESVSGRQRRIFGRRHNDARSIVTKEQN
tara:strand:+ start:79 stop:360 length:282 start_codon:yes stop_codon:yes gene_type:complete